MENWRKEPCMGWTGPISGMMVQEDGKSVQGHVVLLGGGPIDWHSKQIHTANKSTCDAELIALHTAITQAKKTRMLLDEISYPEKGPTIIYEDNKGAIDTVKSDQLYKGESYVVKKLRYIKDQLLPGGSLQLIQIGTKEQLADQFTKAMGRDGHYQANEQLGMLDLRSDSGGVLRIENPSP